MKENVIEAFQILLLSTIVTFVMVAVAIAVESNREVPRADIEAAIASFEPDGPRVDYECDDLVCNVSTRSMRYTVDCREDECTVINHLERNH